MRNSICGWAGSTGVRPATPRPLAQRRTPRRPRTNLSARCSWIRRMSRRGSIWLSITPRRRESWAAVSIRLAIRLRSSRHTTPATRTSSSRASRTSRSNTPAEAQYRAAIQQAKNPADMWLQLADFYRRQGRLDEMRAAVQSAMALPHKPAESYFDAAYELYQGGRDYPEAVQYLQKYLASGQLVESAPAFRAH